MEMDDSLINQLSEELDMKEFISVKEPNHYLLSFDQNNAIEIIKSEKTYSIKGIIGTCPKEDPESFLMHIMEANLFGTGTKSSVIGLNEHDNLLTLSSELDYNISYKDFKIKLEDFVNVLNFWRNAALKGRQN